MSLYFKLISDTMNFMSYRKLNPIIKKFIFVVFLYGLTSASFNGFFGIYIKELGYSEHTVGEILSLRRLSVGILAFLIAILSEKIGHKKSLLIGLFTVGISSILIVLVEDVFTMKILAVVFGFGQAAMMTVESPFIYSQTKDEERVHAFSLAFATRNAAFVTGSLLTGLLAEYFSSFTNSGAVSIRYALVILSSISLLAVIPLSRLKPKVIATRDTIKLSDFRGILNKKIIMFLIYSGFIGLGAGLVVPFFGIYLKYMLDTTEGTVGVILSIAQLGTVIGGLSVPLLSKRIGSYKTIIATQLLSIPLLIMIGLPQGIIVVAVAFFLRSSLMNMSQPLIRNISMTLVEHQNRSMMSALRAMVNNLSRALGIFISGILMTRYTYNTPYIFTILFYIIGTTIFYLLFRKETINNSI